MKKILSFILCSLVLFPAFVYADAVEDSINNMINNVTQYTLDALGEQKQQEGITNLNDLEVKTLALKQKILSMQQTQTTQKYLTLIEQVLSSIAENKKKLENSIKNQLGTESSSGSSNTPETLSLSGVTFEVGKINPTSQTYPNLDIFEEEEFDCSGLGKYVVEKIGVWSAWNSCSKQGEQISFFAVVPSEDQAGSYIYNLYNFWFKQGLKSYETLKTGTGLTKGNILETNINLSQQADYLEKLQANFSSSSTQSSSETGTTTPSTIEVSSQTLSGSITLAYSGEKVGCESVQNLANERYGWAAWNTCNNMNGILSFNVLGIVDMDAQSYIYEKHTINFSTKKYTIQFLESGTGVNKENLIEKNRELKTKVFP